ncbi:hypothetical protein [Spirosoma jeollabukense]
MLLESKGIKINRFYVPPFTLSEGELVVLFLPSGDHYFDLLKNLASIFSGQIKHNNVVLHQPLSFVKHYEESALRRLFYPVTVGEYIKKNAKPINTIANRIYELDYITPKTKIISLAGTPRKLLSLYSTLSFTDNITFDLLGIDPTGATKVYEVVKNTVRKNGAAILLDNFDDMKDDCTKFITLEVEENDTYSSSDIL